jgi:hypothetical protein
MHLPLAPVATVGLALWVLAMAHDKTFGGPVGLTAPLAALMGGYAIAELALIRRYGPPVEPWLVVGTVGLFVVIAAIFSRVPNAHQYPGVRLNGLLIGLALLLGTVTRPTAAVAAAWTGLCFAAVVAVWISPGVSARDVTGDLIWPLMNAIGAHVAARGIARLGRDLSARLADERQAVTDRARRESAQQEMTYLMDVLTRGETLCDAAPRGAIRSQVAADLCRLRGLLRSRAELLA